MDYATLPFIAITSGEPAGVGPELLSVLTKQSWPARLVLLGDRSLLSARASSFSVAVDWPDYTPLTASPISVLHLPVTVPSIPGQLQKDNVSYVLNMLNRAVDGAMSGEFAAIVTGPIHKGIINDAFSDSYFSGHTEYLAQRTGAGRVVMLMLGAGIRLALATTHLPLRDVPNAITSDLLVSTLLILKHDLHTYFGIERPKILVAGLNPHAGEGGHIGREEIEVIIPALNQLRDQGMILMGPLSADTLFSPEYLEQSDVILAMYHDQGLPVFKRVSFSEGVNMTLGLPIIRTSVDHGTALDLAGTGRADAGSLFAATRLAIELAGKKNERIFCT